MIVGYRPGHILLGYKFVIHIGQVPIYVFTNPLKYFLGLGYAVKTLFPLYWYGVYRGGNILMDGQTVRLGTNFMSAFWIGLIVAAIITVIIYTIKLRGILKTIPKTPLPIKEEELYVKKKSID